MRKPLPYPIPHSRLPCPLRQPDRAGVYPAGEGAVGERPRVRRLSPGGAGTVPGAKCRKTGKEKAKY